jgi:uncharacterized membrane protein YqjE
MSVELKDSALVRGLSDLVNDVADLFQKELRLAKAEIAHNVSQKLNAGMWMGAAGFLALLAAILILQALVFALVAAGVSTHWACLLVALVLAALGAAAFFKGKADSKSDVMPERTVRQIKEDIKVTKEQFQ